MFTEKARIIALTVGIFWGTVLLLMTIIAYYTGYGEVLLNLLATVYIGYEISLLGSTIGFIYGFLDGFISVYIFIMLYRYINKRVSSKK